MACRPLVRHERPLVFGHLTRVRLPVPKTPNDRAARGGVLRSFLRGSSSLLVFHPPQREIACMFPECFRPPATSSMKPNGRMLKKRPCSNIVRAWSFIAHCGGAREPKPEPGDRLRETYAQLTRSLRTTCRQRAWQACRAAAYANTYAQLRRNEASLTRGS